MKIIASYNVKGGVGKTSAAVNLAYLAARDGRRTLLWDLDPQGAATYMFRVRPRVKGGSSKLVAGARGIEDGLKGTDFDGLDLLPADFTYRNMDIDLSHEKKSTRVLRRLLDGVADDYDVVFLDSPPSLSLVSVNVLHAADVVLVPIIPTVLAVRTYDQLVGFVDSFNGRRPRVHGFFSMVNRRKTLHRDIIGKLPADRPDVGPTGIPALSAVEQMAVHRAPLPTFAPHSPATRAYEQLWRELTALL